MSAGLIQAIGLFFDIVGFSLLVSEVGFSHRIEILRDPSQPLSEPDASALKKDADSYRKKRLQQIMAIRKAGKTGWRVTLFICLSRWQIWRRYRSIERARESYRRRRKLQLMSNLDALLRRRLTLFSGAGLVFFGFALQLIGTLIGLFQT